MKKIFISTLLATAFSTMAQAEHFELPKTGTGGTEIVPLSELDISKITNGWGVVRPNKSISNNTLSIAGDTYAGGLGVHSVSRIIVKLNGSVTRFSAKAGVDDGAPDKPDHGIMDYRVIVKGQDGKEMEKYKATARRGEKAVDIDVDVNGWKYLILEVTEGNGNNWGDHFNWANAYFEYQEQNSTRPEIVSATALASPFVCATTTFSLPGVRYMHKVRTTKEGMNVSVSGLPQGLKWNEKRQLVEGTVQTEGTYTYTLTVSHNGELRTQPVTLNVNSQLQQPTPFMGWLSWNTIEGNISGDVIKKVADAMKSKGLCDAGYKYLVIDDLWHAPQRHSDGRPKEDPLKFPEGMKASADYVHGKGLKFGIYSDAAATTCAGAFGSYGYEDIDAKQYAEWDVDLLKYDYCHAPGDQTSAAERYKKMGDALKKTGRDILFYMCEWGVREPWKWGTETGATTWRSTYDTRDCWIGKDGGIGVVQSIKGMKDLWPYSGVNRFNDADMMCIGIHGKGKSSSDLCLTGPGMTMDEYRTQFALWCMWSSPLTLSFDMTKPISDEDLALMTHPELIAINQDPMGQQAELVGFENDIYYFAKDLANGDVAISATNMSATTKTATFDFSKISALDPTVAYHLRNVWTRQNEGTVLRHLDAQVASHATVVYLLSTGSTAPDAKNTLYPSELTPANQSKIEKKLETATLSFRLPISKIVHPTLNVTNDEGNIVGVAALSIAEQAVNIVFSEMLPTTETTTGETPMSSETGITTLGTLHFVIPEGTIVAENETFNPTLRYQYTLIPEKDHTYTINFEKDATISNVARALQTISLDEEGGETQTKELANGNKAYNFLEETTFELHADAVVTPAIRWNGAWMHTYIYIDADNSKQFEVENSDSPELVSFNHYNGTNKTGAASPQNPGSGTLTLPPFNAPKRAGTYRMRIKIDWNNIDPAGALSPDDNTVTGRDGILSNSGSITDIMIKVVPPSGINSLSHPESSYMRYHLSGRHLKGTPHGLYIENGQKIIRH